MPLDFPSSPVDGQVYDNWIYSSAKGAWLAKPLEPTTAVTSDTAPPNPIDGDMWYNTNDGTTYVWFDDGDSAQWVEMTAPITANGYYSPNYIINGAFDINQRGLTSTTSTGYGFDRWLNTFDGGTVTTSSQTFTPGTAPSADIEGRNYIRIVSSGQSAVTHYAAITNRIEDVRTLAGKTVTVSFWARAASGSPKVGVTLQQQFGTGGSGEAFSAAAPITISTSWQRYSATVNVGSLAGKTIGANSFLGLWLMTSTGSTISGFGYTPIGIQNTSIDLWGVQLEEGSVATAFRRNSPNIQAELAACQRYYWRQTAEAVYGYFGTASAAASGTLARPFIKYPVKMRTAPTAIEYGGTPSLLDGTSFYNATNITIDMASTETIALSVTVASGLTQHRGYYFLSNNSTTTFIGLSAEL